MPTCQCGARFRHKTELLEHLALQNTRYPHVAPLGFQHFDKTAPKAILVESTQDARRDKVISLEHAKFYWEKGKLDKVDLGNAYPNSFMRKSS